MKPATPVEKSAEAGERPGLRGRLFGWWGKGKVAEAPKEEAKTVEAPAEGEKAQ